MKSCLRVTVRGVRSGCGGPRRNLPRWPQPPAARSSATLRVGLWTLWRDKQVTVSHTLDGGATLRTCGSCAATRLTRTIGVQAAGDSLGRKRAPSRRALAGWPLHRDRPRRIPHSRRPALHRCPRWRSGFCRHLAHRELCAARGGQRERLR